MIIFKYFQNLNHTVCVYLCTPVLVCVCVSIYSLPFTEPRNSRPFYVVLLSVASVTVVLRWGGFKLTILLPLPP
jgi:formate hydrogenlyase subunit 3/multisubunit Na+/H+ antiporter MnhD subunit